MIPNLKQDKPFMKGWRVSDLATSVKNSSTIDQALRRLRIRVGSDSMGKAKLAIKMADIDISHMTGKPKKRSDREIFCKDSVVAQGVLVSRLKKKRPPVSCACCSVEFYTMQPSGFIVKPTLDHINGINTDNRLENLRWVCSNCHAVFSTNHKKNAETSMIIDPLPKAITDFFECK